MKSMHHAKRKAAGFRIGVYVKDYLSAPRINVFQENYKINSCAGSLQLGSGLKKSERAQLSLDLIDKSANTSRLAWRGRS